jgi:glycerol uptake facilitator-like aquaporin
MSRSSIGNNVTYFVLGLVYALAAVVYLKSLADSTGMSSGPGVADMDDVYSSYWTSIFVFVGGTFLFIFVADIFKRFRRPVSEGMLPVVVGLSILAVVYNAYRPLL